MDWQKAYDRVNLTKLVQILKGAGIDWLERRLVRKLYMDQSVKLRLDQAETKSLKFEKELDRDSIQLVQRRTYQESS
jgi:hypothetical protein